jgi:hypothetical protein
MLSDDYSDNNSAGTAPGVLTLFRQAGRESGGN